MPLRIITASHDALKRNNNGFASTQQEMGSRLSRQLGFLLFATFVLISLATPANGQGKKKGANNGNNSVRYQVNRFGLPAGGDQFEHNTFVMKLNDLGQVVGNYRTFSGERRRFVYDLGWGTSNAVDLADATTGVPDGFEIYNYTELNDQGLLGVTIELEPALPNYDPANVLTAGYVDLNTFEYHGLPDPRVFDPERYVDAYSYVTPRSINNTGQAAISVRYRYALENGDLGPVNTDVWIADYDSNSQSWELTGEFYPTSSVSSLSDLQPNGDLFLHCHVRNDIGHLRPARWNLGNPGVGEFVGEEDLVLNESTTVSFDSFRMNRLGNLIGTYENVTTTKRGKSTTTTTTDGVYSITDVLKTSLDLKRISPPNNSMDFIALDYSTWRFTLCRGIDGARTKMEDLIDTSTSQDIPWQWADILAYKDVNSRVILDASDESKNLPDVVACVTIFVDGVATCDECVILTPAFNN